MRIRPIELLIEEEGGPESPGQARMSRVLEKVFGFSGIQEFRNPGIQESGNGKQEQDIHFQQSNDRIGQGFACRPEVK